MKRIPPPPLRSSEQGKNPLPWAWKKEYPPPRVGRGILKQIPNQVFLHRPPEKSLIDRCWKQYICPLGF